jgi:hypothetical protein
MADKSNHSNSPHSTADLAGKAKSFAGSLASRGKAAAQLVAKQAERTKLASVNLPGAYQALGKHLHDTGRLRSDLPDRYRAIDTLLAEIQAIQTRTAGQPKAEGFAARAKAAAQSAGDVAQLKTLQVRLNHALGELGEAAFERYGERTGPVELIRSITDLRARMTSLDMEIADLSKAAPGQILTPKRIALAGVASAVIVVLLVGRSFIGGSKSVPPGSNATDYWKKLEEEKKQELPGILKKCLALADTDPDGAAELLRLQMVSLGDEMAVAEAMADMPKEDQKKLAEVKRRAKEIRKQQAEEARADHERFEAEGGWNKFKSGQGSARQTTGRAGAAGSRYESRATQLGLSEGEVAEAVKEIKARGLTADERQSVQQLTSQGATEEDCYRAMAEGLAYRKKMLQQASRKPSDQWTSEEKAFMFLENKRRAKAGEPQLP